MAMARENGSAISLPGDRSWFLYVGEVKAAGLNRFLQEPLAGRYGKPAECIHIVPDVLAHYPEAVFLVVGPGSELAGPDHPERINSRIPVRDFGVLVSEDRTVRAVVDRILDLQGELVINVFEVPPTLSFIRDSRIKVIGPDPAIGLIMNNKLYQYEMARRMQIPVPTGEVFMDFNEALSHAQSIFELGRRAFVSEAFSAGGSNSLVASTIQEIIQRFPDPVEGFLVTEYIDHRHDPTVLGIVAGQQDVYIASVADQNIQGTRFMGSTFPTVLDEVVVKKLKDITRKIGSFMGGQGYRGAFGCDFIVDEVGDVFFIEVNARKQGTTMETTLTMLHALPGSPTFPELEMMAVLDGCLPRGLAEIDPRTAPFCWGTYNYKAIEDCRVDSYIPPAMEEDQLFRQAARGTAGHLVLDHTGPGTMVSRGSFVARIVAAGRSHEEVAGGLKAGAQAVHGTIRPRDNG